MNWYKIAQTEQHIIFNANNLLQVEIEGYAICIAKYKQQLIAFAAKCPHASAALVNGHIDALGNIVCPLHYYKFNALPSKNETAKEYYLKKYAVEVRIDGVFIGLKKNNTNI